MLSFTATGIPYNTPDGCAADACAASDLRSSLMGVRQAFSRLTLTMRSAPALALASASLGSLTLRRPRAARAWAPGRSRLASQGRARPVLPREARACISRGGTAHHPGQPRADPPLSVWAVRHSLTVQATRRAFVALNRHIQPHGLGGHPPTAGGRAGYAGRAAFPRRGRAPLFDRARRQGLEEARWLRQ